MEFAILIALVIAVLEIVFSGTWSPFYFRIGIPIFVYEARRKGFEPPKHTAEDIEDRLPSSIFVPLKLKKLAADEYAVREAFWSGFFRFTYTPIMHGNLKYTPRSVRISGLVNWFTIAFSLAFISLPFTWSTERVELWYFPVFLLAIIGIIYAIQAKRFKRVADIAASLDRDA